MANLRELQAALIRALHADDPVAALPPELRSRLDPRGVEITGLLVRKLRFGRILRGDPAIEKRFRDDPKEFTERFREYEREVAPTAYFPPEEKRLYRDFLGRRRADPV